MKRVNRKLAVAEEEEKREEKVEGNPFTVFSHNATVEGMLQKMICETGMDNDILDVDRRVGSIDVLHRDGTEDAMKLDRLDGGEKDYIEWDKKFSQILHDVSDEYNVGKYIRSSKRKKLINGIFRKMHIGFRFSLNKENETMNKTIKECLLRINEYDSDGIQRLEEIIKNNCVEGIRKNSDVPLWGFHHIHRC